MLSQVLFLPFHSTISATFFPFPPKIRICVESPFSTRVQLDKQDTEGDREQELARKRES